MFQRRIAHAVRGLKCDVCGLWKRIVQSHRSRGAWIEIPKTYKKGGATNGRIAHAVRGLKYFVPVDCSVMLCRIAHAVRGLKSIELPHLLTARGRIAHAVRGLKLKYSQTATMSASRIAHAVRGLKFGRFHGLFFQVLSHRSRGAWIEILSAYTDSLAGERRIAHAVRGLKS